jgi:hypothetical protein
MLNNDRIWEKRMKSFRNLLVLSLAAGGLLLAGTAAKADPLTITLDSPYQAGPQSVFTFDGTITNTSGATVYLNGDFFLLDSPLTYDDTDFVNNAPPTLDAGASSPDIALFTVTVPFGTPMGLYTGTFQILGGGNNSASDVVASANFDIQVTPEPPGFLLLATGLLALGALARRKLFA